jgi:1-acyl-sn-glycerol-3-phosphate acyltransferase
VRLEVRGERPRRGGCLIVANHVSWLDVMAINAVYADARFVCKLEIASWPLLGWLLKRAGTFFMRRGSAFSAWRAVQAIAPCLGAGANVVVFAEGTTTPGDTLLPFRPALFQSAVNAGCAVQPVALAYSRREAAYTGETPFGESLLTVAGAAGLSVSIELPPAFSASGITRREAARRAHAAVLSCLGHLEVAEPSHGEPMLRAA